MKKILITKRFTALLWALVLTLMPMSLMADNTPLSVTVTFEAGSFVYEQAGNAFDGKPETKWCGGILTTNNTNAYVQVQLAEKSKLDYYYLYTGNDINYKDDDSQQQRNPKEWKLYAKVNEGDEWTLISHVTDAGLPTTVCTRSNNYKIDAAYQNIEYNYLKFEILQVEQGTIFEVGEICFIKCNHTFGSDDICTECGYEKQQDDDFVTVASASQMYNVLSGNARAKVRLTADIYLSDLGADFGDTFCSTFYGILDGDGHAIKGDHYADGTTERRNRCYLFTYADGATFKNLTFKHIRKNSEDHSNQAIITSQAKNNCVFENITFENCGTWTNYDNAGSAAGYAVNCTFTNITVKNSDFTSDDNQAGCVVGHAIGCTFTNIKVENCESTSADDFESGGKSGGIAGHTDDCTITNVEIRGCFIKTYGWYGGGVVGYAKGTQFTNCIVDDQSCVCASAYSGGIVGYDTHCNIDNCINSALIAADDKNVGGIVGYGYSADIVGCLNTGMAIAIGMNDVKDGFYNKYKTKSGMTCVTKTYQGKGYVIRKYGGESLTKSDFGGIAGKLHECNVSKCVNFGSVYSGSSSTGGIAGCIRKGTISDCLSDFSGSKDCHGICLIERSTKVVHDKGGNGQVVGTVYYINKASIKNCLNMTTYKDFYPNDIYWDSISGSNNYSLTTASDVKFIIKTTVDELLSGKICHLLGENWQQIIATDSHPEPGSEGLRYARAFSKEQEYGTVCVPYALKSDDNISYYTFAEASEGSDIQLKFEYADEVDPGTPVLFRVAKGTKEVRFNNAGAEFLDNPSTTSYPVWNMLGTFEQKVFEGDAAKSIYYLSGGEIKNAKKTTIAPYRAYFSGPSIETLTSTGSGARISIVIDGEEDETSALELVYDYENHNDNRSYTLFGTEAGEGYRGIVIRGGKKVIVNN